jgi:hypothetical protein
VGNEEPCFGTCDGFFPVFCHSAAPSKPCEGPLDYPPAWDDLKAFRGVGALDDLQWAVSSCKCNGFIEGGHFFGHGFGGCFPV